MFGSAHFTEDCVDETVRMKISLGEENSMTLVGLPNLVQLLSQDDSDHVKVARGRCYTKGPQISSLLGQGYFGLE